ncbi:MAG: hypothetical protein QOG33_2464, partial [Gaiellales bacterium]|nr:hypothetical protein [Gaiellales bacterium]
MNFGHGALAAAGAYVFYDMSEQHGIPWPIAAIVAIAFFGVVSGLVMERLSRRLTGAPSAGAVVATIGLLVALRQAAVIRYGASARTAHHFLPTARLELGGVFVTVEQLVIGAVAATSALALY